MSTITKKMQGKSTFAFHRAVRRAKQYMQKKNQECQIECIPQTYPQHHSQISRIGIVPKVKILKAHLEDVFGTNRVISVSIVPRKRPHIRISCDMANNNDDIQAVKRIARLYVGYETVIHIEGPQQ